MPVETSINIICDGCQKAILDTPLYPVYLIDPSDNRVFFHDYDCLIKWAEGQKSVRDDKIKLAEAHKRLHAAIDATDINKEKYQFDLNVDPVMPGVIEQLSLADTEAEILKIQKGGTA